MFLRQLTLSNYRAYESATLDLPEHGLVVIAGANNSGKSALLAGLDLFGVPRSYSMVPHDGLGREPEVTAVFHFSPDDPVIDAARRIAPNATERISQLGEITVHVTGSGSHVSSSEIVATGLEGSPLRLGQQTGVNPGVRQISSLDVASWFANGSEQHRASGGSSGITDNFFTMLSGTWHDEWNSSLAQWQSRYFHLGVSRSIYPESVPIRGSEPLATDGSNLARSLLELNTNNPRLFRQVASVLQDVVPELGSSELRTPVQGDTVSLVFVGAGGPGHVGRNIADMGSGIGQLLLLAHIGETYPDGAVIVVEEPETHIHPGAQRQLLSHMQRWALTKTIVLATHSSVFLDRTGVDIPIWLVERPAPLDNQQVTTASSYLRRGDAQLSEVLKQLGVRPSDVLGSEGALVVEGPSDLGILDTWFASEFRERRIALVAAGGGDEAWRFKSLAEIVEALPSVVPPTLRFLLDRDERTPDQLAALESNGAVLVLARREIENYLMDPLAISKLLAGRSCQRTPEDITTELKAASLACLPLTTAKQVDAALSPRRLLDRLLMKQLGEEPVSLERFRSLVKERIALAGGLPDLISERWLSVEGELLSRWDKDWELLAPGADVLEAVFRSYGVAYEKEAMGRSLASLISPPDEIRRQLFEIGFPIPEQPSAGSVSAGPT